MTQRYEIRLYDTPLLTFCFAPAQLRFYVDDVKLVSDQFSLFPMDLDWTPTGVTSWLKKRTIPRNREYVRAILSSLGLESDDLKGIIDICKGLSLNDSYWVVPEHFPGKFSEYNLYENRFSDILAGVAYTGISATDRDFTTSPELTTNGTLPKAWRNLASDGIYLYKGGSTTGAHYGDEPFAEFYAAQIAETLGLNAVSYDLEEWKGILASKCKLFSDIDRAFVPVGRIVDSGDLQDILNYYDRQEKPAFSEGIRDMLAFDALIFNPDRHTGNYGVLRDNRSGKILAPAPLFDHGLALGSACADIERLEAFAKSILPANETRSFEKILGPLMTRRQRDMLKKIEGFTFRLHPKFNWPEKRLRTLEEILWKRAAEFSKKI